MHSNYYPNDTNLDCTASTGHTLQALLCDHMYYPHCNKAQHVLKFTEYFTNEQCTFYWYFILNSTTNYKITGKENACIQRTTDKIQYFTVLPVLTSGCRTAQMDNSDVYDFRRFSPVYLELSDQQSTILASFIRTSNNTFVKKELKIWTRRDQDISLLTVVNPNQWLSCLSQT